MSCHLLQRACQRGAIQAMIESPRMTLMAIRSLNTLGCSHLRGLPVSPAARTEFGAGLSRSIPGARELRGDRVAQGLSRLFSSGGPRLELVLGVEEMVTSLPEIKYVSLRRSQSGDRAGSSGACCLLTSA